MEIRPIFIGYNKTYLSVPVCILKIDLVWYEVKCFLRNPNERKKVLLSLDWPGFSRESEPIGGEIYIYMSPHKNTPHLILIPQIYIYGSHNKRSWEVPRPSVTRDTWKPMVWVQEKNKCPSLRQSGRKGTNSPLFSFLMLFFLQTRWGPSTAGKAICFIQSTDSNAHLMQKHPQKIVYPDIPASDDTVKLTHKINHHTSVDICHGFDLKKHLKHALHILAF